MTRSVRLSELADRLQAGWVGDGDLVIDGVKGLEDAGPSDLSFCSDAKHLEAARRSAAGVIVTSQPDQLPHRTLLISDEPQLVLAGALELIYPAERPRPGAHPTAVIAEGVALGEAVSVGPLAVIGRDCRIGDRTEIGAGCVLGAGVEVGADCVLHPRAVIQHGCRTGSRCILHPGVVIGGDGYGFTTVAGVHHRIPHVGIVVLEDDVELGANTCVDRAMLGETRIGRGTKVDDLVMVGHNVRIGEGCLLVAQVGIAGSAKLGRNVVLAGRSGVSDHVEVGDGCQIAATAVAFRDLPPGQIYAGVPARPYREWMRTQARVARLGRLAEQVKILSERIADLERRLGSAGEER